MYLLSKLFENNQEWQIINQKYILGKYIPTLLHRVGRKFFKKTFFFFLRESSCLNTYLLDCARSWLWYLGSWVFAAACSILVAACEILVAACELLQLWHKRSGSLTKDWIQVESQPLHHQRSPDALFCKVDGGYMDTCCIVFLYTTYIFYKRSFADIQYLSSKTFLTG